MQAVIMAAGKSTRTYPLTVNKPKAMLPVLGKPLLHHILTALKDIANQVIIIVGFEKDQIIQFFGDTYLGIKIIYIDQKNQNGTGGAILCAKDHLNGKFIVLNGDDYISKEDIRKCLKYDYCVLSKEVADPKRYGILKLNSIGNISSLIEKPKNDVGNLANIGVYLFDTSIFDYTLPLSPRGEYEITDYVNYLAKKKKVAVEKVKDWFAVTYPWNILELNVKLLRINQEKIIKDDSAIIEDNVVLNGYVHIGKNSVIKSGSYLEGPIFIGDDCEIGPLAHLRPDTIIGNGVRLGKTETVDTLWMDKSTAKHSGYVGHSVIGENVNIGAGTITADYRHDGKANMTVVKGQKVDSGRRKLGAFLGDGVHTAIGTLIYPGRKLWPGTSTLPGEVVTKDKEE